MPKLICPNCAKFVTVPDEAAGTTVPCPECQAPFPVPARYDPVVSVPPPAAAAPPPPVAVPPVAPPPAPPGLVPEALSSAHAAPPVAAGYAHTVGISLKPSLVAWVPAVGLTLVLVLTLFTWVGSYVGGSPVYSESAWGALWNAPYVNHRLEALLKQQTGWPADVLNKATSDWPLLLPYLLMLVAAVALAWTERLIANPDYTRLPKRFGFVADVWPYRVPILVGLAVLTTALLFAQSARGFGLERAMRQAVAERFAEDRRKNEGNPAEQAAIDFKAGEELNRFNLERTSWFELTVGLHLLVVLAMVGRFWLDRRGTKPHPRIVFQY